MQEGRNGGKIGPGWLSLAPVYFHDLPAKTGEAQRRRRNG